MTAPTRIIVVDDDREMRRSLEHLLSSAGWEVETLSRGEQLEGRLTGFDPDVVLSDVRMPGIGGLELLRRREDPLSPPIVLISAHGDIPLAVEAMQAGAYSFLEKPYDPRRLLTLLRNAARQRRLRQGAERLRARLSDLSGLDRALPGDSPGIRALRDEITDLGDARAPILILGEPGVGKAAVARALHDLSPLSAGPFLALDCADPAGLAAALDAPRGPFAEAEGGTLFLSEIGAAGGEHQPRLLRAVEGAGEALRAGALRLICSAPPDLAARVEAGAFRRDLFYAVGAAPLALPALRERREDIALIYAQFLAETALVYETAPPELTADDLAALLAHHWPGNQRELRLIAERHVLAARRGRGSVSAALGPQPDQAETPETLREAVAAFERRLIARALRAHQGRMDDAAEALGIGRRTLNEKIVKLGLDKSAVLDAD